MFGRCKARRAKRSLPAQWWANANNHKVPCCICGDGTMSAIVINDTVFTSCGHFLCNEAIIAGVE